MKGRSVILLLGFLLGLAVGFLAPRLWDRLAPPALRGEPTVGTVESKRWEGERLLLTVVTDSGALLATFTQRVAEIDLLVDPGDTVGLALRGYRPFVDDPTIERVVKRVAEDVGTPALPGATAPPPPPAGEAVETGAPPSAAEPGEADSATAEPVAEPEPPAEDADRPPDENG